jgi:uncharacterized protein (DUF1330 family)
LQSKILKLRIKEKSMATYFIVYQNVTNPERYQEYFTAVAPLIQRHGGRLLAQGMPEVMEGTMPWERAVLLEWRSQQDFFNFWHSQEYVEIRRLREGATEWQAALVPAIEQNSQ